MKVNNKDFDVKKNFLYGTEIVLKWSTELNAFINCSFDLSLGHGH